jgi:hypothetical protein
MNRAIRVPLAFLLAVATQNRALYEVGLGLVGLVRVVIQDFGHMGV